MMVTILLVEDNEMNRDMLSRRLERKGFAVIPAVNGADAVSLAREQSPDLILMDMNLPVLDGWEATRRIKAESPAMPIIGLTAHAMAGDQAKCLAAGCDDYDVKPVDFPGLLAKIHRLLGSAQE